MTTNLEMLLAAITLTIATPALAAPLTINHADGGKHSPVGAGHTMESNVKLSDGGRVDVKLTITNRVALNAFCGRAHYYFLDAIGNVLWDRGLPQMCADATLLQFGPGSHRIEVATFHIPADIAPRVAKIGIVHAPGGKDPLKLLHRNLEHLLGIYETAKG